MIGTLGNAIHIPTKWPGLKPETTSNQEYLLAVINAPLGAAGAGVDLKLRAAKRLTELGHPIGPQFVIETTTDTAWLYAILASNAGSNAKQRATARLEQLHAAIAAGPAAPVSVETEPTDYDEPAPSPISPIAPAPPSNKYDYSDVEYAPWSDSPQADPFDVITPGVYVPPPAWHGVDPSPYDAAYDWLGPVDPYSWGAGHDGYSDDFYAYGGLGGFFDKLKDIGKNLLKSVPIVGDVASAFIKDSAAPAALALPVGMPGAAPAPIAIPNAAELVIETTTNQQWLAQILASNAGMDQKQRAAKRLAQLQSGAVPSAGGSALPIAQPYAPTQQGTAAPVYMPAPQQASAFGGLGLPLAIGGGLLAMLLLRR